MLNIIGKKAYKKKCRLRKENARKAITYTQ